MNEKVYVVFRNEFFQGELIERDVVGVFTTSEGADEAVYELESINDGFYDPTARTIFKSTLVELDTILDLEE
jgi:hypothetical protein